MLYEALIFPIAEFNTGNLAKPAPGIQNQPQQGVKQHQLFFIFFLQKDNSVISEG